MYGQRHHCDLCHRVQKNSQPPEVGIKPGPQDLKANTLSRRCKSRLLQRRGRVFAFRSCGPGSIPTSDGWDFSAPCDIWWPVCGSMAWVSGIKMEMSRNYSVDPIRLGDESI